MAFLFLRKAIFLKASIKSLVVIAPLCLSIFSCSHATSHNETPITGEITQERLLKDHQGFQSGIESYRISPEDKAIIAQWPSDLHIDIFFGTWCHDSQREVPRILSILKENTQITSRLVALGIDKSDPKNLGETNNVKYTPTMIIRVGDKEIGRIVERPIDSLVSDITGFIKKNNA